MIKPTSQAFRDLVFEQGVKQIIALRRVIKIKEEAGLLTFDDAQLLAIIEKKVRIERERRIEEARQG